MGSKINPGHFDCYGAALIDEPMLVFLARDDSAPGFALMWAAQREDDINAGLRPPEDLDKVAEARKCAAEMKLWREMAMMFPGGPRWKVEQPPSDSDHGFRHAARAFLQEYAAKLQRAEAETTVLRMSLAEADARIETLENQDRVSAAEIARLKAAVTSHSDQRYETAQRCTALEAECERLTGRPYSGWQPGQTHQPKPLETISGIVITDRHIELVTEVVRHNADAIRQILFGEPPSVAPAGPQPHNAAECTARDPDGADDMGAPHETTLQLMDHEGSSCEGYYDCSAWNYGRPDEHRAGAEVEIHPAPVRWRLPDSDMWQGPAVATDAFFAALDAYRKPGLVWPVMDGYRCANCKQILWATSEPAICPYCRMHTLCKMDKPARPARGSRVFGEPYIPAHERGADILTDHPRAEDISGGRHSAHHDEFPGVSISFEKPPGYVTTSGNFIPLGGDYGRQQEP